MKRSRLRPVALLAATLAVAGAVPASAKVVELGGPLGSARPGCPERATCRVVTRTTAYQTTLDGRNQPFIAPGAGRIVAFKLALGDPDRSEIRFFDSQYGAGSRVQLTVVRPVGPASKLVRKVVAHTAPYDVAPYFGTVAQWGLRTALPVRKGDLVALTVPTWAPILQVGLPSAFSWRSSRRGPQCDTDTAFKTQTAQQDNGDQTLYRCRYTTARLTYTATFVSNPTPKYDKNHKKIK